MDPTISVSVCIPCYGKPARLVQGAADSVADDLSDGDEILVCQDGPDTSDLIAGLEVPRGGRLLTWKDRVGLPRHWNRLKNLQRENSIEAAVGK